TWFETLTMWSLSLPQVAATLAAALVGVRAEVIPATVFNAVIVLMLVTAIAGPVLTSRFARQLSVPPPPLPPPGAGIGRSLPTPDSFKVVVPIHQSYPQKYQYLVEMGALLARHEQGIVIPLTIAKATVPLDEPQLTATLEQGDRLLTQAQTLIETFAVAAQPQVRIDDDVAQGISRTAREQQASLILMGWSPTINLTALLLGSILDKVFWSAHCPVAVLRLLEDPAEIRRILVPIKLLSKHTFQNIRTVQVFADTHDVSVTYLHVCDRQTPPAAIAQLKANLTQYLNSLGLEVAYRIVVVRHHDIAKVILRLAHAYDLVVLQAVRRRTAGGLAVSDVTTKVIAGLKGSVMLFGEPHRATDEIYIELPLPPTTDSPPA
ncbi:MAG: universal stress protein, partial [Spirulinaceae cyanobacterium]